MFREPIKKTKHAGFDPKTTVITNAIRIHNMNARAPLFCTNGATTVKTKRTVTEEYPYTMRDGAHYLRQDTLRCYMAHAYCIALYTGTARTSPRDLVTGRCCQAMLCGGGETVCLKLQSVGTMPMYPSNNRTATVRVRHVRDNLRDCAPYTQYSCTRQQLHEQHMPPKRPKHAY